MVPQPTLFSDPSLLYSTFQKESRVTEALYNILDKKKQNTEDSSNNNRNLKWRRGSGRKWEKGMECFTTLEREKSILLGTHNVM